MELFIKILGVAFVAATTYFLLKSAQPQIANLLIVVAGILILLLLVDPILNIIGTFSELGEKAGVGKTVFSLLLKIIGIGYLTEYAVSLCEDSGCASLGKKIELAGKIVILVSALPIIKKIIEMLNGLL